MASDNDNDDYEYEYAYSSGDEDDDADMNNDYAVDDDDRMNISNSGFKLKPAVAYIPDNPTAAPTGASFRGTYRTQSRVVVTALPIIYLSTFVIRFECFWQVSTVH